MASSRGVKTDVRITADGKQAVNEFRKLEKSADRTSKASKRLIAQNRRVASTFNNMRSGIIGLVASYAGFRSVIAAVNTIDRLKALENRLRLVTSSNAELLDVQGKLVDVSKRTRTSLVITSELYARTAIAADALGKSSDQLLQITELVTKAVALSGATAQESRAGLIQFAQGLASNRLQGDELRSVLENLPALARAIAKGLGVSIGEIRTLAAEGKLTAKEIVDAIVSQKGNIERAYKSFVPTVAQSFEVLGVSAGNFLKTLNDIFDISGKIGFALAGLSDGLAGITESIALENLPLHKLSEGQLKKLANEPFKGLASKYAQDQLSGISGITDASQLKLIEDEVLAEARKIHDETIARVNRVRSFRSNQYLETQSLGSSPLDPVKTETTEEKRAREKREKEAEERLKKIKEATERLEFVGNAFGHSAINNREGFYENIPKLAEDLKALGEVEKAQEEQLAELMDKRADRIRSMHEIQMEQNEKLHQRMTKTLDEQKKKYQEIGRSISDNIVFGLREGQSAAEVLGNILDDILNRVLQEYVSNPLGDLIGTAIGGLFGGGPISNANTATGFPAVVPGYGASGGTIASSGLLHVGEHGPETLLLPKGAELLPKGYDKTGQGGGDVIINVNGVSDPASVRNAIRQATPEIKKAVRNELIQDSKRPNAYTNSIRR